MLHFVDCKRLKSLKQALRPSARRVGTGNERAWGSRHEGFRTLDFREEHG